MEERENKFSMVTNREETSQKLFLKRPFLLSSPVFLLLGNTPLTLLCRFVEGSVLVSGSVSLKTCVLWLGLHDPVYATFNEERLT
jgi:hypothetical protein